MSTKIDLRKNGIFLNFFLPVPVEPQRVQLIDDFGLLTKNSGDGPRVRLNFERISDANAV